MWYILLGLLGFGFIAVAEWAAVKRIGKVKPIAWGIATLCFAVSTVKVSLEGDRLAIPLPVSVLGWVGVVAFAGLFIYSSAVELSFHKAYVAPGADLALVTTGTYALTRHPGFLWYSLFLLCLLLATRSQLLLIAAPLWSLADGLYVWFEEKAYFEKMFEGYREYQRLTPMLLPTPRSIRRFLSTWAPGKRSE